LGGRHLTKPDEAVVILGMNAFRDTKLNLVRAYLDTDWGMRTVAFAGYGVPLTADIPVTGMMSKLQSQHPERRDELIELLGIDPEWRMNRVSDGQRRRVQLFLGLVRPFSILLLDEVTVSLDVVVRHDLLRWLRKETETRGCTVIYATHIFDGLDDWPSHLHFITNKGQTGWQGRLEELEYYQQLRKAGDPGPLLRIAERWLRTEIEESRKAKIQEKELGQFATAEGLNNPTLSAGGFGPGRMYSHFPVDGTI
jgi:CCR4-NOT complex subunit CAF16